MDRIDAVIVGAGVIGLACARELARAGREVVVLEREGLIGSHTSSRNSEVIHAGIYYEPGSAKARLCLRGREMLYEYCAARAVPHRRLGKIIVATEPDQEPALAGLAARAVENGVNDLRPLDRRELAGLEPELRGVAGLFSPSTGIIDSHALMLSLRGEAEDNGAMIAFGTRLAAARPVGPGPGSGAGNGPGKDGGLELEVADGSGTLRLRTGLLVNAAGLFAGEVAAAVEGLGDAHRRRVHYCKGHYFGLTGRAPFRHLIYPAPERDGLGVHLTLDLAGAARFGPDTEWLGSLDYAPDPARAPAFEAAIRRYWPGLPGAALHPDYAGIRPKLFPAGGAATDFTIEGAETHGVPGLVNLFGIESPGLTAALAIAGEVADLAAREGV